MIGAQKLTPALALGWSLLLTLGLFCVAVVVSVAFGATNQGVVVGSIAELLLMLPAARFLARVYGDGDERKSFALQPASRVEVLIGVSLGVLLHHPDRTTLLRTFQGYLKISKDSTPQLARHMGALEGGMLALLGQGTEPE